MSSLRSAWNSAVFLLVCRVLFCAIGEVQGKRQYYKAAVYEHVRFDGRDGDSPRQIVQTNLRAYETAVETAANQGADIIVFPEWGLFPNDRSNLDSLMAYVENIPDPFSQTWNPCRDEKSFKDSIILRKLSCFARDNRIFIVANMADVKPCYSGTETCDADDIEGCKSTPQDCHPDGKTFYNTNVVFDRKGDLVARYYKTHLYFEKGFSSPLSPKPSFFETDFGNFTTFICFDMCFQEAVEAVEKHGVWNVAFPTYWYDHFPLSLANEYQQAWSMINNVNFLAANVQLPGTGTVGSGIYSGKNGALAYIFNPNGKSRLLISDVPISRDHENNIPAETNPPILYVMEGVIATRVNYTEEHLKAPEQCSVELLGAPKSLVHDYRCKEFIHVDAYATNKLEKSSGSLDVCHNDMCCSLTYEADAMDQDFFLGAFSNLPNITPELLGMAIRFCVLIRCNKDEDGRFCETFPMSSNTSFRHVTLQGDFSSQYVYPMVLGSGMQLVPVQEWSHWIAEGKSTVVFNPDESHPISTIALFERRYDKDIPL